MNESGPEKLKLGFILLGRKVIIFQKITFWLTENGQ